ncbi:MAG: hypothetical protein ABI333_24310 [bacterium]
MAAQQILGRSRLAAVVLVVLALLPTSCSLLLDYDPDDLLENTAGRCSDGVDNDDNGLTDCAELDCAIFDFCHERSEEACRDRVDNDRDGLIDCADPGCLEHAHCTELPDGKCEDLLDNNGNGLVDCQDFTCRTAPACCTLKRELLLASLEAPEGACEPGDCQLGQTGSSCNAFDPLVWQSFGDPAPTVGATGLGFDPNRCASCLLAGTCGCDAVLLSQASFPFRAGLLIAARLHVADGTGARAGATLTWQTSFDETGACPDGEPPLDRVAGVELTRDASGGRAVTFVVDGVAEGSLSWPEDQATVFVRVDGEGFARFYLGGALEELPREDTPAQHRSNRPLPESTAPMRLAIYGGGEGLRVSAAEAWDTARCHDPVPTRLEAFPQGAALVPLPHPAAWDHGMISDPTVVLWNGEYHMYYVGRTEAPALGSIGHAVLVEDGSGLQWVRDPVDAPVITAGGLSGWPEPGTDLYGPSALGLPDGRLVLYFTLATRDGEAVLWTGIVGAQSPNGIDFVGLQTPEGQPVLLGPRDANPDSWERAVRDPSVTRREVNGEPVFTMLYTGRADPENPFTAQIGLATSGDGVSWTRGNPETDGCLPADCNQPVVTPPADSLIYAAVSDPALVWDPEVEIFRLWYVWRLGQEFSLYHAVAAGDARTWATFPGNPVLRSGDETWCDDSYLDGPSAWLSPSGRLQLWYHGHSQTTGHAICYAENTIEE